MPKALTDAAIQELSIVFAEKDGVEWAPRNPAAKVLAVKGAPSQGFLAKVIDRVKKGWLVADGVPDNIDHDGDGADDYEAIVGLLCSSYYDLQSAMGIGDDEARSVAICTAIDNLLEKLDDMRSGEDEDAEKAGARHSAADKEKIDAIGKHVAAAQKSLAKAAEAHAALVPAAPEEPTGNDDKGEKAAEAEPVADETEKAKGDEPKPYGDVEYADPKHGKYPIDTKEHAKAAWSYINQEKNAAEYSADELASVKAKIKAACEKFGVEISDEKASPAEEPEQPALAEEPASKAEEVDMDQEALAALIADAAQKAATAAVEATKAALQPEIDAAKAAAEKAQSEADAANARSAALAGEARKTSAVSAEVKPNAESRLQRTIKAQMLVNQESTRF